MGFDVFGKILGNLGWRNLVELALPILEHAGQDFIDKDTNDVGKDDLIGQAIVGATRMLKAALSGDEKTLAKLLK
jgi:hypothetical protein